MKIAEAIAAQSYPVYEQRLSADAQSQFRLYDCLVPTLKHQLRVPKSLLPKDYQADLKLQIDYKRAKEATKLFDTRKLNHETQILRDKVKQLEDELESVDWYIKWERMGKTPRQFILEMDEMVAENVKLQDTLD